MSELGYTILDALREIRHNSKNKVFYDKYLNLAKRGINPLHEIVKDYESEIASSEKEEERRNKTALREQVVAKAKATGEWFADYSAWTQTIDLIKKAHKERALSSGTKDLVDVCENYFDAKRDADLIAHALFVDETVRDEFKGRLENLYRAVLRYGLSRQRGARERAYFDNGDCGSTGHKDRVFSEGLELLIANLPANVFAKDDAQYTNLRKLIRRKANREALVHFKQSPEAGIRFLENSLAHAKNKNVKFVCADVLNTYKSYMKFGFVGENKQFEDSLTHERGGFPSVHQRIGVYHALDKQRFGVLDGCGTGKTAIGALLYPLILEKKKKEGKEVHNRVVVVGTIPCFKTWKKGFEGSKAERYTDKAKKIVLVNGGRKDEKLLEELRDAEVIFANYQQLNTNFIINGAPIPSYKVIADLGYDLLVFDEVHNIRNINEKTANGRETASAAARFLAFNDPDLYFLLLSGTPMPDNLEDYAMIYHLLRPDVCKDPDEFIRTIKEISYDPHTLSTFIDENTIRRTAEQVNNLSSLNKDEWYDDVSLTPVQRQIHDYLVSHRPIGWLMEARKALVDPRLASRETLERAGITAQPTINDSSKYARLEEMVAGEGGCVEKEEKFVIFSSVLKDGITRMKSQLHDGKSLKELLEDKVKKEYGSDKYIEVIDGDVDILSRESIANKFRDDKNMVGIMCTTDTGGESLDFSFATNAFFLDEDYSPATTEQAIARLWRRGQAKEVNVKFLRGLGSIDSSITEYVDKKSLAIKIALDGHPPTPDEIALLTDSGTHSELTRMINNKFGGISVDLSKFDSFNTADVEVRSRGKPTSVRDAVNYGNGFDSTRAQQIGMRIGKDKDCWFDEKFVAEYVEAFTELAPYVASRLRVLDVLGRASRGEISFPDSVLSLGSGPGILYGAYQDISSVVESADFKLPRVHDLDFSAAMLKVDKNPVKICANMLRIPAADKSYDFVDTASVSLLKNPSEVLEMLREARRVLKPNGLLELSVKELYFKEGFHGALRDIGFEPVTKKNDALSLSKQKYKQMAEEHGHGFADSCKSKADNWQILLARKVADEGAVSNVRDLWFMTDLGSDYASASETVDAEAETAKFVLAPKRRRMRRPKRVEEVPKLDKSYVVNKDGTVDLA